jgi:arginase family enzyme
VLAGVRDVEPAERRRLYGSELLELGPGDVGRIETLPLPGRTSLHIDLDVLDPAFGQANEYAVAPGISPADLLSVVRE